MPDVSSFRRVSLPSGGTAEMYPDGAALILKGTQSIYLYPEDMVVLRDAMNNQ
jgi:hypothetical protein